MVRPALGAVLPALVRVVFADEFATANGAVRALRRGDADCRSIKRVR